MDEVGVAAAGDAGQHRMLGVLDDQVVPAHVRNFQAVAGRRQQGDVALDPAEPGVLAVLAADLGHQLHADADAEERPALLQNRAAQRLDHARQRFESAPAVGKGADAGQHDPLGGGNLARDRC